MQPVSIGNIEVRRVEEMIWTISPRFLFADVTYDDFARHRDWLVPHFCAEDLKLRLSIHTFVVRTPQHTILVDTCIGNDRKRDVPLWTNMRTDYLARLSASGVNPARGGLCVLHPHACRPCGLEYPSGRRPVGADISKRQVPVPSPGVGVLEGHQRRESSRGDAR